MTTNGSGRRRFGDFELDSQAERLFRSGSLVKIQPQPLRVLAVLVQRGGEVVSREELRAQVWDTSTFVEFDQGLNYCIRQIRLALGDSAAEPVYLETLPKQGYRFIAPLKSDAPEEPSTDNTQSSGEGEVARRPGRLVALLVILAALGAGGAWFGTGGTWWSATRSTNRGALDPVRLSKITYFPGDETDPAFSPDGRSIAFSWNGEGAGNSNIYRMPVGGHIPVRLTRGADNDLSPAWSPDGGQIAFLRRETVFKGKLMSVPAVGGPERIIREVRIKEDVYREMRPLLTWAPDGSGIVYTSQDDGSEQVSLYLTDPEGKSARKLIAPGQASLGATAPAFTRDGRWLAYVEVYGPYQSRLFVRPLAAGLLAQGEASPVTEAVGGLIMSPVWSPDGQRLLFTKNAAILEWQAGRSPRPIYVGNAFAAMSAAWGQGGQSLNVVTGDTYGSVELRAIPLRPGGLEAAGDSAFLAPYVGSSSPAVSPDGKLLIFHSRRSGAPEIWVMDENGQNARQLTHLNTVDMGYPRWSRDGKHVAFHASLGLKPQIFTMDMERISGMAGDARPGDAVRQITDSEFGFYAPTWSADGKYIYSDRTTGGSRIFRIPVEGGTPEDLFEGAVSRVTADGHGIVYGKIGHLGMFMRSLDGDPATNSESKLVEDYHPPGNDLNPVSDGIYYIGWNGAGKPRAVRFYNYAQKKSVDVAALPGRIADTPGLAVTPDRRRLVYSVFPGAGKDLTLIEFR